MKLLKALITATRCEAHVSSRPVACESQDLDGKSPSQLGNTGLREAEGWVLISNSVPGNGTLNDNELHATPS